MAPVQRQSNEPLETRTIRVRGLVQGVGFRPSVWRLAQSLALTGSVRNDGNGVLIEVCGYRDSLQQFTAALQDQQPPLARIDTIELCAVSEPLVKQDFTITESARSAVTTAIAPDAATCQHCRKELLDRENRRYCHPFINCTHCGPRFSICRSIPYDRANTSMAAFAMCEDCRAEYQSPGDRRYHAQPIACANCGPAIQLIESGQVVAASREAIGRATEAITAGSLVAIKGIGGFHLACDARNADAVAALRLRKQRPLKPLAVMARDLTMARAYCEIDTTAAQALQSPAAPIVILPKLNCTDLADAIAPGLPELGFMLPYSPLHHLLMKQMPGPIVLTSGNRSDEPQCIDNDDALRKLSDIADLFLIHNRDIVNRVDDSVARVIGEQLHLLRRARGFAPGQLSLPGGFDSTPQVLAMGGELKNTFCLLRARDCVLSQHMGDLENPETHDDYRHNLELYRTLFEHRPAAIAVDLHPDYIASHLGRQMARDAGLKLVEVQHHHAHIAACMAENRVPIGDGPVLGIALDGLGCGTDNTLWGGEILRADYTGYRRLARLKPVAMPGATRAILEPWRNTLAHLQAAGFVPGIDADFSTGSQSSLAKRLGERPWQPLLNMINSGFNSPLASSAGRLFDAVSFALGLAPDRINHEGEAAIRLEAAIERDALDDGLHYPFVIIDSEGLATIDPAPMWRGLIADLENAVASGVMAARFHSGLSNALAELTQHLAATHRTETVALTGGVFQNVTLFRLVRNHLQARGLRVLYHRQIPANDGGLALGQALIAAATLLQE